MTLIARYLSLIKFEHTIFALPFALISLLVASGGIRGMADIELLDDAGIDGVIVGKAIYEHRIDLKDIETYLVNKG